MKSRARVNEICYHLIHDGPNGHASYELEFPNGGVVHAVGNFPAFPAMLGAPDVLDFTLGESSVLRGRVGPLDRATPFVPLRSSRCRSALAHSQGRSAGRRAPFSLTFGRSALSPSSGHVAASHLDKDASE